MANVMGPPVEGTDFFGRGDDLYYIIEKLIDGNNILLTAPRRVGKTSFALRVLYLLQQKGWKGIYVDLEGIQDELMAVRHIIKAIEKNKALWKKIGKSITDLVASFDYEVSAPGVGKVKRASKAEQASNLLEKLGEILIGIEHQFLIIIDELPVFLLHLQEQENGKERVRNFLNRLRSYRISPYGAEGNEKALSWFFCGSIGLENYAFLNNLSSTINDLFPFEIGAFENDEAINFIKQLCKQKSLRLQQENIEYLIEKAGWPIPYYLRLIYEEIWREHKKADSISNEQIDLAYQKAIERNKTVLDLWIQRLRQQLDKDQYSMATKVLNQIAKRKAQSFNQLKRILFTENSNLQHITDDLLNTLTLLSNEGYLVLNEKKYIFRSPLVRDWWKLRNHL